MQPLTEQFIRASFINASRKESKDMALPANFDTMTDSDWQGLEYFGWNDPKFAKRAYAIVPRLDSDPVGISLRRAEATPRSRAMCNWCRDVRLPNTVAFWSVRRVGDAGRKGNTVGTLICENFECSKNVRNDPPAPYDGFDQVAARERRIDELLLHATSFAEALIRGD